MCELSKQQKAVLEMWMKGFSAKEIARHLNLTARTVEYYKDLIFVKYNTTSDYQIRCMYWGIDA